MQQTIMKIINNGSEFQITYNHTEHTIPSGDMEITDDGFGAFILMKARQWGLGVSKTGVSTPVAVKPIEVLEEDKEVEIEEKEVAKEDTKKTKETKKKTKK